MGNHFMSILTDPLVTICWDPITPVYFIGNLLYSKLSVALGEAPRHLERSSTPIPNKLPPLMQTCFHYYVILKFHPQSGPGWGGLPCEQTASAAITRTSSPDWNPHLSRTSCFHWNSCSYVDPYHTADLPYDASLQEWFWLNRSLYPQRKKM